jgi:hemerythrin superfamily protein
MDALTLLTADHNRVRGLFTRWKAAHEAGDTSTAGELFKKMAEDLQVHTDIEETVFYPAIDGASDELHEMVMEALEEHKVAKSEIHEASMLPAADDRFAAKVTVLIESVEHHAEEEESEMWTAVRKALSGEQLEQLGQALEDRKKQLGAPTLADKIDLTKTELVELAKNQEIPGRSKMDHDELAATVAPTS